MDKLHNWSAKRAGGRMTIEHSTGKIAGIDTIAPVDGRLIATHADGRKFELVIA